MFSNHRRAGIALLLGTLLGGGAGAHDAGQHQGAAPAPGAVTLRGLDTTLLDQDGRAVHVGRDVIGKKIVVVGFVYTACTTVCPMTSAMLAELQARLGDRVGRDVQLVTVTVDPLRDTPARLKAYAAKFNAKAGWTWLSGSPVAVNDLLKGMGAYSADFTQHPQMVLVGDAASGHWTRFSGLPDPARLAEHVRRLDEQRIAAKGG